MIKIELHAHTADDPEDRIPYTAVELVDRAAALQYGALAVTLHNEAFAIEPLADHARRLGIVLLRGIERTIEGKHVLLINAPAAAMLAVRTFGDLARLRRSHPQVLVIAPHPFYPVSSALGRSCLERHAGLIDAVECSGLYTRRFDFNQAALVWARAHDKPVVGNSDLHRLPQLGNTYSLVDAEPEPDAICAAIRAGRVELRTAPLSFATATRFCSQMIASGIKRRWVNASARHGSTPL